VSGFAEPHLEDGAVGGDQVETGETFDGIFAVDSILAAVVDLGPVHAILLDAFYAETYAGLLLFAARKLGSDYAFLAEDCVQDAIFSTYQKRSDFPTLFPAIPVIRCSFAYSLLLSTLLRLS